jgi:bifunctional non-homologous end joining protein LigD
MTAIDSRSMCVTGGCASTRSTVPIGRSAAKIKGSAIIDAEVVWLDAYGMSNFEALHSRVNDARASACAFDLLMPDSDDLRGKPYSERKAMLLKSLRRSRAGIQYVEHTEGNGSKMFRLSASSAWRGSSPRSSMRHTSRDRRRPGSRSKTRKHPQQHAQ